MDSDQILVLIPAIKKVVAFQDDLVKRLNGISLIQRSINLANMLTNDKSTIYLFTDSEEISLIADRNGINNLLEPKLLWNEDFFSTVVKKYLTGKTKNIYYTIIISPYAPLLTEEIINEAKLALENSKKDMLKPVTMIKREVYSDNEKSIHDALFKNNVVQHAVASNAFSLFKTELLNINYSNQVSTFSWPIEHDLLEIYSFQDWWVCEKILKRKRIIFRVIGNIDDGMGHLYRALALAHDITEHEILFICDSDNEVAVNQLAGYDYWLGVYEKNKIVENIIKLKPDLVINDILSTKLEDVIPLKDIGIKVAGFEDLGPGAVYSDLIINELYEINQVDGGNILWGHHYFFLRDEFHDAVKHRFKNDIDEILLAFGGTDQLNLSSIIFHSIRDVCKQKKIKINIVTGPGYKNFKKLESAVKSDSLVLLTRSTGVISSIMEKSQVAITSNGRTLYELAHLNIPAIVISQHKREDSHEFACKENGFIPIGIFKEGESEEKVLEELTLLIEKKEYRKNLFEKLLKFEFHKTKKNVLKKLIELLPNEQ